MRYIITSDKDESYNLGGTAVIRPLVFDYGTFILDKIFGGNANSGKIQSIIRAISK